MAGAPPQPRRFCKTVRMALRSEVRKATLLVLRPPMKASERPSRQDRQTCRPALERSNRRTRCGRKRPNAVRPRLGSWRQGMPREAMEAKFARSSGASIGAMPGRSDQRQQRPAGRAPRRHLPALAAALDAARAWSRQCRTRRRPRRPAACALPARATARATARSGATVRAGATPAKRGPWDLGDAASIGVAVDQRARRDGRLDGLRERTNSRCRPGHSEPRTGVVPPLRLQPWVRADRGRA